MAKLRARAAGLREPAPTFHREIPSLRAAPLLHFVLGVWLGGSVILGMVVAYNFAGIDGAYFAAESVRFGLVCLAALWLIARAMRSEKGQRYRLLAVTERAHSETPDH